MVIFFSNALQCNLANGIAGNREMVESITVANSQNFWYLFSKSSLIFKTIASAFPFVVEIVIVTEWNTKLETQSFVLKELRNFNRKLFSCPPQKYEETQPAF